MYIRSKVKHTRVPLMGFRGRNVTEIFLSRDMSFIQSSLQFLGRQGLPLTPMQQGHVINVMNPCTFGPTDRMFPTFTIQTNLQPGEANVLLATPNPVLQHSQTCPRRLVLWIKHCAHP
jgi:hypothetical protein